MPDTRQQAFIQRMAPLAAQWSAKTGIPPEVFIAIGASESNYGSAGSIFGVKGSGSAGSRTYNTWEMVNGKPVQTTGNFAVYKNDADAFNAFINLVSTNQRYKPAWDYLQRTGDAAGWLKQVNAAGYATDPQWSSKILNLAST